MWTITGRVSDLILQPADLKPYAATVWRLVEAQHRISTNRLAASAGDQALLEQLVEEVKPPLPSAARKLHYLLATPFRYGYAKPSRAALPSEERYGFIFDQFGLKAPS